MDDTRVQNQDQNLIKTFHALVQSKRIAIDHPLIITSTQVHVRKARLPRITRQPLEVMPRVLSAMLEDSVGHAVHLIV